MSTCPICNERGLEASNCGIKTEQRNRRRANNATQQRDDTEDLPSECLSRRAHMLHRRVRRGAAISPPNRLRAAGSCY